jgi:Holliday junction resolvase RusA-like endonuclease
MIVFKLNCNPPVTTSQMKKVAVVNGKPRFYEPKQLKKAKQLLISLLEEHAPQEKLEGALSLDVVWMFPRNKTHKHTEYRTTKPDTDNLQKMLKDCMTLTGFWNDDAQVVVERCCKVWVNNENSGIVITISELPKFM